MRVEGTVIGQNVDAQGLDMPLTIRGQFPGHVVITRECRGGEVLDAVLDPFHRPAQDDGGDDRHHIAGIDADLVAEAATNVR